MKKLLFFLIFLFSIEIYSQEIPSDLPEELIEQLKLNSDDLINNNQPNFQDYSIDGISDESQIEEIDVTDSKIFGVNYIKSIPKSISATSDLPVPNDYVISLNDELKVILSGSKKNIYKLVVGLDGTILFPELGMIQVAGESFTDVKNKLQSLVSSSYIGVELDLSLSSLAAKKISILGAVKTPGTYLVNPFTTISNVLAYSGGIEDYSSLRNITLIRGNERFTFDLYDLLIFGDRSKDLNIKSGDTILVSPTTNHIEISGEVLRPKIYEYTEDDSFENLIEFALGFNAYAESENITSTVLENGRNYSMKVELNDMIGNKRLLSLYIGKQVTLKDKDLFVTGSGVTSGYYSTSGENFSDLLKKLKFSDDIYPFYAIYEQEFNSGLSRKTTAFSLADPSTYRNLKATKNSRLFFYNRDYILDSYKTKIEASAEDADPEIIEAAEAYDEENPALESDYAQIFLPGNNIRLPVIGKLSPKQIHLFLGGNESVDLENVAVITTESSSSNSYNLLFDSSNLVAISFPPVRQNLIEVSISGEVRNPGTFLVSGSTKLTELYILSGGFLSNSFQGGIRLFREDVKEKQIKALREAKALLTDSLVQKSASVSERGAIDIEAVLELADLVEPTGRVAGDFSENSDIANKFILKDGDTIFVPAVSVEVTVQGEVLNSSSFIFDADMDYNDYIEASGGYTSFANKRAAFIIRANGESTPVGNNIFSGQAQIYAGDTIVIPRDLNQLEALPLISMATKIISDIAFSAASLNAIQD